MQRYLPWLLLGLLLPGVAVASDPLVEASMVLTGTITVNPDGSVRDFTLQEQARIPAAVLQMVKRSIAGWRFAPVMLDGKAEIAEAGMSIRVVADVTDKEHATVRIAGATFGCQSYRTKSLLPGACPPDEELSYARTRPPDYPWQALRASAQGEVYLVVEIGRDGKVTRAAARQVNLFNRIRPDMNEARIRDALAQAAERAALQWEFRVPTAGPAASKDRWTAQVPVNFLFDGTRLPGYGKWSAYLPGPIHSIPWSDDGSGTSGRTSDAIAGSEPFVRDKRFILKTPLDAKGDSS